MLKIVANSILVLCFLGACFFIGYLLCPNVYIVSGAILVSSILTWACVYSALHSEGYK